MSSKATLSVAAAVVFAGTVLVGGQSFAASTPTPVPSTTRSADDPAPVPNPSETRAPRAEPVRRTPHFTG